MHFEIRQWSPNVEEIWNSYVQDITELSEIYGRVSLCNVSMFLLYFHHFKIFRVAIDLLSLKMSLFTEPNRHTTSTLLENYLASPELDFKDVIGVVCDFLLAGIDTVCSFCYKSILMTTK